MKTLNILTAIYCTVLISILVLQSINPLIDFSPLLLFFIVLSGLAITGLYFFESKYL